MATYDASQAAERALKLTQSALEAGWFMPTAAQNYKDSAAEGKKCAEFLGAFIKQLTAEIQSL